MNKFSIDRFEGDIAVLERVTGAYLYILRSALPTDAREGTILTCTEGNWTIQQEETEAVREELFDLAESLFSDDADF